MNNNPKKTGWALFQQTMLDEYINRVEQLYKNANRWSLGWTSVFARAWNRFSQNHANESAAGVAFFSIFSVVPLLVFIISSVSSFFSSSLVLQSVGKFLANAFPVSLEGLMDVINSVLASNESPNLIATIGLLWSASNMFNFILYSINRAWSTQRSRGFVKNRLLALVFVTALAVLVVVLLILISFVRLFAGLLPQFGNRLLTIALPLFIQVSLIFLIYKFAPTTTVDTKSVLIGAILVTLALDITTRGFTWYLDSEWANYNTLYGSLGALISLLFWVFLSYWILLFGAYLSEAIYKRSSSDNPNQFFEPLSFIALTTGSNAPP